jgi:hypothetical protein
MLRDKNKTWRLSKFVFISALLFSNCTENPPPANIPPQQESKPIEPNESNVLKEETSDRFSANFEVFLKKFLEDVYSEKDFNRLVSTSSPLLQEYIDEELGFGRFWNAGIYCNLYTSDDFGLDDSPSKNPDISGLIFFPNKSPKEGFCESSASKDGIYYKEVTNLPADYNMDTDTSVPVPKKYKPLKKMNVQILYDNWIIQDFYFIQSNDIWYLLYIDDCDCSI